MNACVLQPNASHTEPHSSSIIYVVNSAEHPFDIEKASVKCASTVISIPIADWNNALTPWPAPGFYENEPWFGGHGRETLEELTRRIIPAIEARLGAAPGIENPRLPHLRKESDSIKRAICGYSLGGLFALYAFANDTRFDACASISGSLWYQGWMNYLNEKTEGIAPSTPVAADRFDGRGRYAFLSVGKKECKSGLPLFRCVEDNMHASADLLRAAGCQVDTAVGPGNHMQHIPERFEAALRALDAFCSSLSHKKDS